MARVCRYARVVTALAQRLAERTLELVDIPSESLHEADVRSHLLSLVPDTFAAEYAAEDAFVFARPRREDVPLVLLVGHYDTVPAQDNLPGRIEDGAVHGCGATDMKGGVAVALEIVRELALGEPGPFDVALLLFGKEELPAQFSPLPDLFERSRLAAAADLAILLEPTDLTIQAGCLGNLNARLTFTGVSGHSARPWTAENAIEKAIEGLAPIAALERREAVVGGLPFYEVVSITQLEAGIASNVIPDRAVATLNFRYAPDRTPESAAAFLQRARTPRYRARAHRGLSAGGRRHRHPARPRVARRRRPGVRAEAGVDQRGRLHDTRDRRDQLRPGRDALRAPPRRARRDRRPRDGLRDAAGVPPRLIGADLPHPQRPGDLPVRTTQRGCGSEAGRGARRDRLRHGRPAGAHGFPHHRGAAGRGARANGLSGRGRAPGAA